MFLTTTQTDHLVASRSYFRNQNGQTWENEEGTNDSECSTKLTTTVDINQANFIHHSDSRTRGAQHLCQEQIYATQSYSTPSSVALCQIGTIFLFQSLQSFHWSPPKPSLSVSRFCFSMNPTRSEHNHQTSNNCLFFSFKFLLVTDQGQMATSNV